MKISRIEYVRGIDSGYSLLADKWQSFEEVKGLKDTIQPVETVGFVIDENDDYIILVQTISEVEKVVRGGYIIYKKNVLERRTVK